MAKTYYFVFCKEDLLLEKTADGGYTIPYQEGMSEDTCYLLMKQLGRDIRFELYFDDSVVHLYKNQPV